MRHSIAARIFRAAIVVAFIVAAPAAQTPPAAARPTFHLLFLGHDIGQETDTLTKTATGQHLDAVFHFVDRGTSVDLTGAIDISATGQPTHFVVKGRNYRLFTSDSEVTLTNGRAVVRDAAAAGGPDWSQLDVTPDKPFFPIDNYAPIGAQELLIQYWIKHGRPAEIAAPPAGTVRIKSRGPMRMPDLAISEPADPDSSAPTPATSPRNLEVLAIEGVTWGTETAFIEGGGRLVALTTWAGALPFEAMRDYALPLKERFLAEAAKQSVESLKTLTKATPALQSGSYALVGATVVGGAVAAAASIPDATVIVRDGRIAAVGPSASTPVPAGMARVDVRGKTIIPGLWDMHAHAGQTDWSPAYLASGVTTIRDMGGEEPFLIAIRDAIASGQALGPRYLLAGLIDGPGPRAFGMVTAGTPDEAIAIVRRYHDEHFQEIKIYIETPKELVPVITAEAHRLGMTVTGHLPQGLTWQTAVEAGYDGIAHMQLRGVSGSDASKEQIAFFKAHGTVMDPTMSWNELSGHSAAHPIESFLPGMGRLPLTLRRTFASMPGGNGTGAPSPGLKLLKDAIESGLLVVAGTDKGVAGFSLQREIELYVDGGMTPLEAIRAATIMPARAMKLDKELGTIEVGKRADLVVLGSNPLDKISNVRDAQMVAANGRLYDCNVLWKAGGYTPR